MEYYVAVKKKNLKAQLYKMMECVPEYITK